MVYFCRKICGVIYCFTPQNTTTMYIHEHKNWTEFRWDDSKISTLLETVSRLQGRLFGRLSSLGFDDKLRAMAENVASDIVYSSEIEGVRLNTDEVRSSIARRLGIESMTDYAATSRYVDGVVAVTIDACEHAQEPLTSDRLCGWQSAFFPTGFNQGREIEVGKYRTHEEHIVSGFMGREKVHYVAPSPQRVPGEMQRFLEWFNGEKNVPSAVASAIAHLWFVSIHPFEDGNGRLARIVGDILLARGDGSSLRFYNMSAGINRDKKHYYDILERTQHGDGDITEWVVWYLTTLRGALDDAHRTVSRTLSKSFFWLRVAGMPMSDRQTATLNRYLDGYEAKITTKQWAALNKCSVDTASRDIQDLVARGILVEELPGAKRPSYAIKYRGDEPLPIELVENARVEHGDDGDYIVSALAGKPVREWIQPLDADRLARHDTTIEILVDKCFAYLLTE